MSDLLSLSIELAQAVKARNQALADLAEAEMDAAWGKGRVDMFAEKLAKASDEIDRLSEAIKAADIDTEEEE